MCKIIGRSQQVGIDKINLNVVKTAFCSDCAGSRANRKEPNYFLFVDYSLITWFCRQVAPKVLFQFPRIVHRSDG
jgi:hypothetical protein